VAVSVDETRQRDGLGHPTNTILVLMASRAAVAAPLTYLPNALTILRLALVPLFVVVFVQADDGSSWAAGWIFLVAGITDQLDGFLARRWHVESRFGKLADPLADRLMLDAAAILLWLDDKLPWYAALIIVLRDVILVGGYRLLMPRGVELEVSKLGKAATWLLYLSLGILLVVGHSTEWPLWLFWVGFGMALVAAAQYVLEARRTVKP
jgi:cardiolipin synthase (CMP-forming)